MNSMSNPVPDRLLGDRRRVVVEHVRPRVDGGEFSAKATRGLPLQVSARVFADGHDPLLAWVWHWPGARPLAPDAPPSGMLEVPMESEPQDWFSAWIKPRRLGAWSFAGVGIRDAWGGFARALGIRFQAGVDVELDLADGGALAAARGGLPLVST